MNTDSAFIALLMLVFLVACAYLYEIFVNRRSGRNHLFSASKDDEAETDRFSAKNKR